MPRTDKSLCSACPKRRTECKVQKNKENRTKETEPAPGHLRLTANARVGCAALSRDHEDVRSGGAGAHQRDKVPCTLAG